MVADIKFDVKSMEEMILDTVRRKLGYRDGDLLHGSKSGLHGEIQPLSNKYCDFGRAFYLSTNLMQNFPL